MRESARSVLFSNSLARLVGFAALLAILLHLLLSSSLAARYQIDLGVAQFFALPLVACGFLVWGAQLLPRAAALVAATIGFLLTLYAFSPTQQGENEVLMARFPGDDLGAESRIFRQQLRRRLPENSTLVITPYHFSVKESAAAREIALERRPNSPFIWFSEAHTIVEFSPKPPRVLKTPLITTLPARYQNLRLFDEISSIMLSTEPRLDTQVFLSNLISGIVMSPLAPDVIEEVGGEMNLLAAATKRAGWRGGSHQAYAWWLLGNRYLWEAVSGNQLESAFLDCAFRAYLRAAKMFKPRDNRELISAIVNNQSVAMALQAAFANDPQRARKARNGFRLSKGYAKGIPSQAAQTEFFSLINGNLKQIAKRSPRTKAKLKKRVRVTKGRGNAARGHSRKRVQEK
ncbi:MAG: hypothetical protein QY326_00890 [Bdellovibrionota bacterium]|nr:MAG: hypothetical protein QY326_00890 [Bdellovibrionota bacterium]